MKRILITALLTITLLACANKKGKTNKEEIKEVTASKTEYVRDTSALITRVLPAPMNGGFQMKDYWVWGSSVIKGEDGKYHMFASRWPKWAGFGAWVTNSEVVRAVSDTPEGPYEFVEVVLKPRGKAYFDGLCTHNPRIVKWKNKYLLYHFGTTYNFPVPTPENPKKPKGAFAEAWMNKRIGLAISESLSGPWERVDKPILEPRRGTDFWDRSIISNPGPVVNPKTGEIYLMYKSSRTQTVPKPPLKLGMAKAGTPYGPYIRLSDDPIFSFETKENPKADVEDPFVWWAGDRIEVIMKDRDGSLCGEEGGGLHGWSKDGVAWHLYKDADGKNLKAYSKEVLWKDGEIRYHNNFERPFLLLNEHGQPTHLFAATGTSSKKGSWKFEKTWNMCVPLKHIK
jgi:hypothetical protein